MNDTVLTTIALTGFGIAFFHAAIPTHWLPFVLTARVQRWSRLKTVGIAALAGTCHVLMTAVFGLLLTLFGVALSDTVRNWFPRIAGAVLFLFGLYYIGRQIAGKGHVHFGYPHEHLHEHDNIDSLRTGVGHTHDHPPQRKSDRAAIMSLLAFLTLSPCEGFLPIYAWGAQYGWRGFLLLTTILSVATVAGMVIFTSLTLAGMQQIKLGVLEKYESAVMGVLLCVVAALILFFDA